MNMKSLQHLLVLLCASLPACHNWQPHRGAGVPVAKIPSSSLSAGHSSKGQTIGPVPLRSVEQLHAYLASAEFRTGDDWWRFDELGNYASSIGGVSSAGVWTTTANGLWLTNFAGGATTTLPLLWLDGKLWLDIDGVHYGRNWDLPGNRAREKQ